MTLLTRKQAAELLGISVVTLDLERQAGRLAFIQRAPNARVWIPETALEEYLKRFTRPARPEPRPTRDTARRKRQAQTTSRRF